MNEQKLSRHYETGETLTLTQAAVERIYHASVPRHRMNKVIVDKHLNDYMLTVHYVDVPDLFVSIFEHDIEHETP